MPSNAGGIGVAFRPGPIHESAAMAQARRPRRLAHRSASGAGQPNRPALYDWFRSHVPAPITARETVTCHAAGRLLNAIAAADSAAGLDRPGRNSRGGGARAELVARRGQ